MAVQDPGVASLQHQFRGNTALAVGAWFVDPDLGDDSHDGTTAPTALKTFRELQARWASITFDASVVPNVVVTQLSDQTPGVDPFTWSPTQFNGCNVVLQAQQPQRGASFHPTTVTAAVKTSAGTRLSLNGNLPAGTAVGDTVINVTKNSRGIVSAVAAGNATVVQPITNASVTPPQAFVFPTEDNTWIAGDTYEVFRPLSSNMQFAQPLGGGVDALASNGSTWFIGLYIRDISGDLGSGSGALSVIVEGGNCYLLSCLIDPFIAMDVTDGDVGDIISCVCAGNVFLEGFAGFYASECLANLQCVGFENSLDVGSFSKNIVNVGGDTFLVDVGCSTLFHIVGGMCQLQAGTIIWGPCTFDVGFGGQVQSGGFTTYANALKVATIHLDGAGTGTKYAAGVWTDGIALTSANIDTNNGLQNPRTGSRFANS